MKDLVKNLITNAIRYAGFKVPNNFSIDTPPKPEMGDFATNVAIIIAGRDKKNPREIAENIVNNLRDKKEIAKVEIAGPGFINIILKDSIYFDELNNILLKKEEYGKGKEKNIKVMVEYISANPTGPLHIGNARGGPIGEALAGLFSFLGYSTQREFYVNDLGGQIDRFAESLYYWYAKKADDRIEFPEGGYPGDYVKEISEEIQKSREEELKKLKDKAELVKFFEKEGLYHAIKSIRSDCELLGIKFDKWTYQSDFEYGGDSEKIIDQLKKNNSTVNKEGALWFKNPDDPELNDRESVLKKSDEKGTLTYFADDIAYHVQKFKRGYKLLIDVWGANHSGHVPRLKAAIRSLGYDDESLKIILYQYVRLKKNGKAVSMGKRKGNFVTLREVIESGVEPDAFKYFILSQNPNTPFDFDLALAADKSEKNPVYYIKYAHARIQSILKKAGVEETREAIKPKLNLLIDPKEAALYKELVKFPELLDEIKENFQIQALPHYAYKIAGLFHDFYANCQVITKDSELMQSRLSLIMATKYILANTLNILGIEAPDRM